MELQEITDQLTEIGNDLHEQFDDEVNTHVSRLQQLDHALATAAMAAAALFDEEAREVDLATRVMDRAKVHGDNEIVSPVGGRTTDHYRVIAKRS